MHVGAGVKVSNGYDDASSFETALVQTAFVGPMFKFVKATAATNLNDILPSSTLDWSPMKGLISGSGSRPGSNVTAFFGCNSCLFLLF